MTARLQAGQGRAARMRARAAAGAVLAAAVLVAGLLGVAADSVGAHAAGSVPAVQEQQPAVPGAVGAPSVARGGGGELVAEWQPPAVDGGSDVVGYELRYSGDGVSWTGVPGRVAGRLWAVIGGLDDGQGYQVQVRAVNGEGAGAWSLSGRGTPAAVPTVRVEPVVGGLSKPWGLAFAGDGTMIFTERGGRIKVRLVDGTVRTVDADFSDIGADWETGLMGLVVDPGFAANRHFYTCQGHLDPDTGGYSVQVVKWSMDTGYTEAARVKDPLVGGVGIRIGVQWQHAGCRLRFGPGGHLWIATGDGFGHDIDPQSLANLNGKMLRVHKDTGEGVPGNPFYDSDNADTRRIYTYGHRNPQGLARRPGTDQMWSVEHGTDVDDEINLLAPGGNYGYSPLGRSAAECVRSDGVPHEGPHEYCEQAPMTDLVRHPDAVAAKWSSGDPTLATSGGIFLEGGHWGAWEGRLAVATLKSRHVRLFGFTPAGEFVGDSLVLETYTRFGRLRTPMMGPDGALYVTTSNDRVGNFQSNDDDIDQILRMYVYKAQADAGLRALWLTGSDGARVALSPRFGAGVLRYTAEAAFDVSSVTVEPRTSRPGATVTVNGQSPPAAVALDPGANTVTVQVTAEDGAATRTYTVEITRKTPVKEYSISRAATAGEGQSAELRITLGAYAPTGGLSLAVARGRAHYFAQLGTSTAQPAETGRASVADDLASAASTVTVAAGTRTATLTEAFADDDLIEGDEHYYVEISTTASGWSAASDRHGPASGQPPNTRSCSQDAACAAVTITDPDAADAKIAFGADAASTAAWAASAGEGDRTLSVPVTVSVLPDEAATFDVEITGGTATEPGDYAIAAKQVTFAPHDTTTTKNVTVTIADDTLAESDETIELRIAPADNPPNDIGDHYRRHPWGSTATLTIPANDGQVQISNTAVTVPAGDSAHYTIRLHGPRPTADVTVTLQSSDTDKATLACGGTDPCVLTFTPDNWDQPQTVTVTGKTAGDADITHTVSGTDPAYPPSLTVPDFDVTVASPPTDDGDPTGGDPTDGGPTGGGPSGGGPGGGGPGGGGGGGGPSGGGPGDGGGGGGGSGDDEDAGEATRLWGPDRYATSLAVARQVAEHADGQLDTVVIAGGHSWADALVAGPLAGALDAAVLLSAPDRLDADAVAWLGAVGVSEIIAVGDTDRISDDALEALADIDADIERITGEGPHAMSAAVARRIGRPASLGPLLGRTVIVASSRVFADALAAGPLAAAGPHPILLVGPDGLHADVAAYLADHADHVIVMGGTAAVTEAVEEQIQAIPQANRSGSRPMAVTRLGGADRYGTAVVFARWLTSSTVLEGRVCFVNDTVGLATGLNAADAAASAPLLAETCTPLVLTQPDRMPPVTASYLRRAAELLVFGGTAAITDNAIDDWNR